MNRTIHDSAAEVMQELSILEGSMDRLRALLNNRTFDKNRPNASGLTPLMAAVLRGGKEHVGLLVENGANPTADEIAAAATLHVMAEDDFLSAQRNWADKMSNAIRSELHTSLEVIEKNRAEPGIV
ncbi:hypothetical protein AB4Z46_10165 [Variovorax sp. M-6]|uniref:hypothetical protein n=1 Tax=Variovorax sp. M-6 TaxID=3233041 RepID=UPI003F9602C7